MIARTFALAFIALLVASLAALHYFLFLEPPYLVYNNLPFPIVGEKFRVGDKVPFRVNACSTARGPRPARVAITLEGVTSGTRNDRPDLAVPSMIAGCRIVTRTIAEVPAGTPPGRYRWVGFVDIKLTMRNVLVPWHTMEFEVVL